MKLSVSFDSGSIRQVEFSEFHAECSLADNIATIISMGGGGIGLNETAVYLFLKACGWDAQKADELFARVKAEIEENESIKASRQKHE